MDGLQGHGSYPHVGPDGDDGAVSNEAPRSQPGAWDIQDDVSSGEETGGGVLAIPQPAGRRSAGEAAGGRATSEQCIICGDSSADVPWWSMGAVDMGDGTFQEGAKGSWCWLCGTTAEAWPLMTAEALAERHRGTPPFRAEFTAARHRAQRNQKQPGAAADMSVATRKTTGIRVAREVAFIELADAAAFFKQDMSRVSGLQIVRLPSPLGGQPEGIVVDMRDIPAGLAYSRVELFTTTVATLSDTVLAEGGSLRDGHAKDTWQFLVSRATAARPRPLQQEEMAAPTACATLAEKVSKMQEALRLKEDCARRQADADGVPVAPDADRVCTASRLASAAQVLEEDAPARAAAKTCVRAGVSGRGAARRGAPGAAGVPPGAPPLAKRARRMGDGAVPEAVDSAGGLAEGLSADASDLDLRKIMMGTPTGKKQRWARPGR